jgi:hypothetical protein
MHMRICQYGVSRVVSLSTIHSRGILGRTSMRRLMLSIPVVGRSATSLIQVGRSVVCRWVCIVQWIWMPSNYIEITGAKMHACKR